MGRCPTIFLYIFSSSIFTFSFAFYTIIVFQLPPKVSFTFA
jgi:hypothetical protein